MLTSLAPRLPPGAVHVIFGLRFQRHPFRSAFQKPFRAAARGCPAGGAIYLRLLVSLDISQTGDACTRSGAQSLGAGAGGREWGGEREASRDRGPGEGCPGTGSEGPGRREGHLVPQMLLFIPNGFSSTRCPDRTSPSAERHVAPARTCWVAGEGVGGKATSFFSTGDVCGVTVGGQRGAGGSAPGMGSALASCTCTCRNPDPAGPGGGASARRRRTYLRS